MRPAPVVTSLVVHVIIALLWLFAFVLYATRMSPVGLGIAAVLLVLQLIGLLGIIRRRSYARTYNAVYFLFWGAFSSLGACAAAGREQDASLFAWGLFVLLFFGWLALSFALAPRVKAYFASSPPPPLAASAPAVASSVSAVDPE